MSLFRQAVTGERLGVGSYVSGLWVPATPTALTIQASIQPASENDLKLLPEGRCEDGAYALRSASEILAGDVYIIGGERHEIIKRQVWQNGVIPHYLGVAVREQST